MVDTQVRIVNKCGKDVTKNGKEIGEIIVKGKAVTSEDLNFSQDGWLHTGDLGTMDEEGRINVVKSNHDINGTEEEISTFDIETVLTLHPAVEEVSVVPQPDEALGEVAHAFVVLTAGYNVDEDDLITDVKTKLAPEDPPLKINFMEELPKTSSGKILKTQLENK
ncbi:hypothetical protein KQI49_09855 [Virgibacillus sp. MSJ-26]|uniref:AMP-binding enzyme n=1 Tax=Virgibacillus sp. MSJ-26 TaxID=2841522 RepID=UPI001C0FC5D5|nr:hypothetical protein [Virgibacillus sp. MSJ-26]MBU5467126.1 hypothetical protein [Virgibacillus sp. MSJ-26]